MTMGFMNYLKEMKQIYKETKEKGWGFPVELEGTLEKFMMDIIDGDHYIALDTNVLCHSEINFLSTSQFSTNRSTRYIVSEHTIRAFRGSIEQNDEYAEIAAFALNRLERAMEGGYTITIVPGVTEEEINNLGFEQTFQSAVICSFYKASHEIEQTHQDWRKLYLVTLSTEQESRSFAQHLEVPTYILQ
ncbi:hypothetical protein [Halalkalibacter alkaliphilus]|uniref:PIN domain-containing protein n=1 Tax=Halalkalibacter alkaliphilus TaxID=2917993 RepID=A0A9X2I7H8_9BACI|nr:hypothetical protein [Halalkalibacter alkaliphilus]MCL7749198.1 hypothetical protein [Halalkalibacter alkaliphilus]